jgi:hypothetical protein
MIQRHNQDAQIQLKPGYTNWEYTAGEQVVESRRFAWSLRQLPVVDRHNRWDDKTYRYIWLRWATFRGTRFGWEAVVE